MPLFENAALPKVRQAAGRALMIRAAQPGGAAAPRHFIRTHQEHPLTRLMNAVKSNDPAQLRQLLAQGADVNQLDAGGNAPLVMAAYLGHTEIVQMLLEHGADVGAVDPDMKATALHAAAYAGRTEAARLLIQYHIEIDRQGPRNGYTALHDAIWQGHVETARLLIEAGADLTLINHDRQTALAFARARHQSAIVSLIEQHIAAGQKSPPH